jgi:DnaJ-class molecular chaperone
MTPHAARMEEARDMCDFNEGHEYRRDPRSGETECDRCDGEGGYVVLVTPVEERGFCCEKCNGSGVMPMELAA